VDKKRGFGVAICVRYAGSVRGLWSGVMELVCIYFTYLCSVSGLLIVDTEHRYIDEHQYEDPLFLTRIPNPDTEPRYGI